MRVANRFIDYAQSETPASTTCFDADFGQSEWGISAMRITVTIDEGLLAQAEALAEPGMTRTELLHECMRAFVQRQSARRLAALGGQVQDIESAPRQREDTAT